MKLSPRYRRALEAYLDWADVKTPASGTFQEGRLAVPAVSIAVGALSAAEALCLWESQGKPSLCRPEEADLLQRYIRGKAQRDWWSKEIGWWNKHAWYMPEEFLVFMNPLAFIDLFGRPPITRLVRYYYDNHYHSWEFRLDEFMLRKAMDWRMDYYERDDRDSSLRNAWRMLRVKWISPVMYRLRRRREGIAMKWLP